VQYVLNSETKKVTNARIAKTDHSAWTTPFLMSREQHHVLLEAIQLNKGNSCCGSKQDGSDRGRGSVGAGSARRVRTMGSWSGKRDRNKRRQSAECHATEQQDIDRNTNKPLTQHQSNYLIARPQTTHLINIGQIKINHLIFLYVKGFIPYITVCLCIILCSICTFWNEHSIWLRNEVSSVACLPKVEVVGKIPHLQSNYSLSDADVCLAVCICLEPISKFERSRDMMRRAR
jgi:hypothetical protein